MAEKPTLEELQARVRRIERDPDSDPNPGETLEWLDSEIRERFAEQNSAILGEPLPPRGAMHRDTPPGSRLEIANAYAVGRLVDVNDFEELPELPLLEYVEPHEFHLLNSEQAYCICGWLSELPDGWVDRSERWLLSHMVEQWKVHIPKEPT